MNEIKYNNRYYHIYATSDDYLSAVDAITNDTVIFKRRPVLSLISSDLINSEPADMVSGD